MKSRTFGCSVNAFHSIKSPKVMTSDEQRCPVQDVRDIHGEHHDELYGHYQQPDYYPSNEGGAVFYLGLSHCDLEPPRTGT